MNFIHCHVFSTIFICALFRIASSKTASINGHEKLRSDCGSLEFRCSNGDCIASVLLCDGRADCSDRSDETREACDKSEIVCPEYAFRCNYGGCVDGDATCNGIDDCLDKSDELLPRCSNNASGNATDTTCNSREFRCNDGQCIRKTAICDGAIDCNDRSDETTALCRRIDCPAFTFRCNYGACIDDNLKCNGVSDCADGSDESPNLCRTLDRKPTIDVSNTGSTATTRDEPTTIEHTRPTSRPPCKIPEQPKNGRWMLHKSQCQGDQHCDLRSNNVQLDPGTYLIYTCNEGYKLAGSGDVFCGPEGKWSNKPECVEIRCKPLSSVSTEADCTYNNDWISCESPVPPRTVARLSCRNSYRQDSTLLSSQRDNVRCNALGQWEPEPIKCSPGPITVNIYFNGTIVSLQNDPNNNFPVSGIIDAVNDKIVVYTERQARGNDYPEIDVRMGNSPSNKSARLLYAKKIQFCGRVTPSNKPLIVNGTRPNITEFPWHATLYRSENPEDDKKFICGATIIASDLLITAAHCVYDETTKTIESPNKFAVATGNLFRKYNSKHHDPTIVKKANVKRIYLICNYLGLEGNYARDIAILHIEQPFTFTSLLMPACLDVTTYSDQSVLEIGNYGKVAGFGRTAFGASSQILQTINVPYVSLSECKSSSTDSETEKFITIDKFCAGYRNGSSVCDGDSGGGLVFKTGGLWYLRGIVSVGIGATFSGGTRSCDSHAYSLYTKISSHIEWIQDVILKLETYKTFPSCSSKSSNRETRK